ncbi:four-carbon acid sugar kinase family protein [Aquamicrobium segne]|uniref:Four-carbon acid sugar kinase family protein n=1 Tax=Aquamicrobium segne TaxID=469547 RepID=A0ABW0GWM9_9HYPH
MTLRLIADDMTGALDAAAPFASTQTPVRVLLSLKQPGNYPAAFSTESRDLPEEEARKRVAAAFQELQAGSDENTLWFKKVDSVLRGNSLVETLEMAQAGQFSHCLFAPAFPEMGRITRAGQQFIRSASGEWVVAPAGNLHKAFAALIPAIAPGLDITIPDSETPEQLQAAALGQRGQPHMLWAGSRGLAQALCPATPFLKVPRIGLFILGTSHPATRAQVQALAGLTMPAPKEGAFTPDGQAPLLLDPVPYSRDGKETRSYIERALERLSPPRDDSAIFITGGDSLTTVLAALHAEALDCLGEIGPGLPLSRLVGGRLSGTVIVTKSGGFGAPDLLRTFCSGA